MELALDNKKKEEQQINQNKYQAGNAPLSQPGIAEQMGTRIKNKAMDETMKKGMELGKESLASLAAPSAGAANTAMLASTPATIGMGGAEIALAGQTMAGAGAGAAGAGAMAALGPIGIGLAADELLGFGIRKKVLGFDEGGQVGPLNAQYHAEGTKSYDATEEDYRYQMPGSLEYEARMAKNRVKQARRASAPVMKNEDGSIDQRYYNYQEALRQLQKQQDFVYPQMIPDNGKKMGALRMAYTDDPIAAKMYDVGNAPIDTSIMPMGFIGHPTDKNGYTARGYSTGGPISYNAQGTMSEEQARALMNNQPEPMPQPPRRRPMAEELFDEIKAEQNYVSSESLSPPGFSEEMARYMQAIGQPFGGRQ